MIKQIESTEKVIGDATFYIRPFGGFLSASISGDVFALILPTLGSLAPMAGNSMMKSAGSVLDSDISFDNLAPAITQGMASLSGEKLEKLLIKLLVKHNNVAVEFSGEDKLHPLTRDLADNIFSGDTQDMFILAVEVIKVNYAGLLKRLGSRFGGQMDALRGLVEKTMPGQTNTAS